jgi:hypothetical protein
MDREAGKGGEHSLEGDHGAGADKASGSAGIKRKSADVIEAANKKAKMDTESSKDEEEEDDG